MSEMIVKARWIVRSVSERNRPDVIENGAILVRDGIVADAGDAADLVKAAPLATVAHYPGHMILPGFINAHHHVGLTPLQLGAQDDPLELWWATRIPAREISMYFDTLYSAFEMLASGITTVQHIQGWMPGPLARIEQVASDTLRAYRDIGMRASYSFAIRQQNRLVYQDDDLFCSSLPEALGRNLRDYLKAQEISFEDNFVLYDALKKSVEHDDRVQVQLAPGNLHWVTDDQLLAIFQKSRLEKCPMHMHLLETPYQREYARRRTGTTALKHLYRLGVLGPHLTLGHGVWLGEEDIELAADTQTCVCHNCSSNLRLRSGVAPLNSFEAKGLKVAIGLDEAGINDDRDMLQEMRLILNMHRTPGMQENVPTCSQLLRMATADGAHTTKWGKQIGQLSVGSYFDAVVIDYDYATFPFQDPEISPLDAIVRRAKPSAIKTVFVRGDRVYAEGKFTKIDRDAVLSEISDRLNRPRTGREKDLLDLSRGIVPFIREFYRN